MEFTPCPECNRSDFVSRAARDNHVYRCKRKEGLESPQKSTPQHASIEPSNSEDILERFQRGDLGEQDAVNEFEKIWVAQNPEPDGKHYRQWSSQRANAVDAFRDKLVRARRSSQVQIQTQQVQQVRQTNITEIAEQRARVLRGEIPESQAQAYVASNQTQAYVPPTYQSQEQSQESQETQVQPQRQIRKPRSPNWIEQLRQRFAPKQEEPEIPERPINEYGQPTKNYFCKTENKWKGNSERTFCDIAGHDYAYVP